jgi:RNA polymerase sigma-70 factor (ECF subfamily)
MSSSGSATLARSAPGDAACSEADFEQLVRDNAGRMLATARRLLRDEAESCDAVQDAFLQAFRCWKDFRGQSQVSTWLHRIVVNAALMRLRRKARHGSVSIEPLLPAFDATGHRVDVRPPWSASADELLERRETREMVRRRIDELPRDYRAVILLRDIEEMSTEDAAEALGITPGAVKTRLHRARLALRTLLEQDLA